MVLLLESSQATIGSGVLAEVNGEMLTMKDYNLFMSRLDPSFDIHKVDKQMLGKVIDQKIIIQEAKKRGFYATDAEVDQYISDSLNKGHFSEEEFKKILAEREVSLAEYKKWLKENIIVAMKYFFQEIEPRATVSDQDIVNYYSENRNLFLQEPEKMRVRCLFIGIGENRSVTEITDAKIKALKVYSSIRNGKSFESFSNLYCESPERHDGVLGEFKKGELLPPLDSRISHMNAGDIDGPVWIKEGAYILQLQKKIAARYTALKDEKDNIRQTLFTERREKIFHDLLESLWEKSSVKLY